nr:reverse transcriptase domain-containing protein [Tanacetum cinerariifolium]
MKVVQVYDATNNELHIPPPQAPIAPPTILPPSSVLSLSPMLDSRDFLPPEEISPKDTKTSVLPTLVSPSSSIGSSSPVRSTTPPPDYPFDKSIFAELDNSLWIIPNCTEDCKVKFVTGTLTEDALSWWNSYAKPIGIEQADKIAWTELKRLLTNKYCPRTDVKKIEDEFYNLVVKGNDLKTYIRRFQELETLCPTMVPNSEKPMEVFIEGLPRSIEGNVTTSKAQTLEEAINITQRLMDHVTKHNSVQETNDHKQKFDDSKNTTNNNYPNDCNNNNHSNNRNNNKY